MFFMFGFYEKRKLNKVIYSRQFLFIVFVLFALMLFAVFNAYKKKEIASADRIELANTLSSLESRANNLENNIKNFENSRGIEEELRERYDVAKDGEEVIVFVEDDKEENTNKKDEIKNNKNETLWNKIFNIFF